MKKFDELEKIANLSDGKDVYIVLTSNHNLPRPLSERLISVISKMQNAAGVAKSWKHPCFVLVNQLDEVPVGKKANCVKLKLNHMAVACTMTQKRIDQVFETTMRNAAPFNKIDGYNIFNEYGPILGSISINPAAHEERHVKITNSIRKIVQEQSKRFSDFQNLIKAVISCKFCPKCLRVILEQLDTSKKTSDLLNFLLDGIETPVDTELSKKTFMWYDDSDRPYFPQFWKEKIKKLPLKSPDYSTILEKLNRIEKSIKSNYISLFTENELKVISELMVSFQSTSGESDCVFEKAHFLKRTIMERIPRKSTDQCNRSSETESHVERNLKSKRFRETPPTPQEPIKRSRSENRREEELCCIVLE